MPVFTRWSVYAPKGMYFPGACISLSRTSFGFLRPSAQTSLYPTSGPCEASSLSLSWRGRSTGTKCSPGIAVWWGVDRAQACGLGFPQTMHVMSLTGWDTARERDKGSRLAGGGPEWSVSMSLCLCCGIWGIQVWLYMFLWKCIAKIRLESIFNGFLACS